MVWIIVIGLLLTYPALAWVIKKGDGSFDQEGAIAAWLFAPLIFPLLVSAYLVWLLISILSLGLCPFPWPFARD